MKRLRRILKNEKGQGMLEYVLLLAIVATLVMTFKTQIKGIFDDATKSVGTNSAKVFND